MFLIFPFVNIPVIFAGMSCASPPSLRILIETHIGVPHIWGLIGLRGVQNPTGAGGEGGAGTVLRHRDNRTV